MRYGIICCFALFLGMQHAMAESNDGLAGALIGAGVGAALGYSMDPSGGAGTGAAIGAVGGYILGQALGDEEEARPAAARHPAHADGRQGSATIPRHARKRNHCRKAQKFYEQAFKEKSIDRKVYLLEKAAWLCERDPRVHNDLGVAYYFRGKKFDLLRARDQFRIALRLRPGYLAPKKNLRRLKEKMQHARKDRD